MITAILYTSNTGTTKAYAEMLGKRVGLPVYALEHAPISAGAEIIYLGWVMASEIKGYKQASHKYKVKAVCGVCMGTTGSQIPDLRKKNAVLEEIPVFSMQGGFDIKKLHGMYHFMMKMMAKTVGKALAAKKDRTPEEEEALNMMLYGSNKVSEDNLGALLDWYDKQ